MGKKSHTGRLSSKEKKLIIRALYVLIPVLAAFILRLAPEGLLQRLGFGGDDKFQKAVVSRVIDGDTIVADIDGTEYKVRFILVNTPETSHPVKGVEPYGKEAKRFTTEALLDTTVYLEKDVSDTDKYGRLLRYVWLKKPSTPVSENDIYSYCFNSILLEQGYAQLATFPPDVAYLDYFRTRADIAKANKAGLYAD